MDDLDAILSLDNGSAAPATHESESNTHEPTSAANSGTGTEGDDRGFDAGGTADNIDGDGADGVENDPWAGYVDFEHNGQVYKVPDALKDGYYRERDYTQKTQALAEERRAFEARSNEIARALDLSQKERDIQFELNGMVKQLERYDQVDWDSFEAQEPLAAQSEFRKFQLLQQQFDRKYGELQTAQTEKTQIAERDLASRIDATTQYAYKNLPGMSPEMDTKVTNFAIATLGYNPDTLKKSYSPQIYTTMYLAYLGHQLLSRSRAPSKGGASQAQAPQQPLAIVNSKTPSGNRKTPAQMTVAEMDAYLHKRK